MNFMNTWKIVKLAAKLCRTSRIDGHQSELCTRDQLWSLPLLEANLTCTDNVLHKKTSWSGKNGKMYKSFNTLNVQRNMQPYLCKVPYFCKRPYNILQPHQGKRLPSRQGVHVLRYPLENRRIEEVALEESSNLTDNGPAAASILGCTDMSISRSNVCTFFG